VSIPFYVPPEQLVRDKAEFARKGIARGRSLAVLEYADGVLLVGENASGSLHKLSEIYDKVAFAGVGRFNEFETLRVGGIRYADVKGYAYSREDVTAKGLANVYSQTLGQIFTHEVKPYEVEIMVAEIGIEPDDTVMFRIQFDGTLTSVEGFGAMGGTEEALTTKVAEHHDRAMPLADALKLATTAIEEVDQRQVAIEDWEAAVLDRTRPRRTFRRIKAEEVAAARGDT
jgi:proteasome alpha subunit